MVWVIQGADKVWRLFEVNRNLRNWSIYGFIEQPAGHVTWQSTVRPLLPLSCHSSNPPADEELYVLHELSSTITVHAIPSFPNGTSPFLGNVS